MICTKVEQRLAAKTDGNQSTKHMKVSAMSMVGHMAAVGSP